MTEKKEKNVKIEINIAGEILAMTVPYSRQKSIRHTEKAINDLFSDWRNQFPRKTNTEILAMVAYQYASYYHDLSALYRDLTSRLEQTSSILDTLLAQDAPAPAADGDPD
ncbi:MAG: cell division protein ZapA [Bacteroides sp.]|nr:cell division protein ZapA [Bacteroides sp.]